jgi:hypothetical protein
LKLLGVVKDQEIIAKAQPVSAKILETDADIEEIVKLCSPIGEQKAITRG